MLEKSCLETPLQNKVAGWALNSELLVQYPCTHFLLLEAHDSLCGKDVSQNYFLDFITIFILIFSNLERAVTVLVEGIYSWNLDWIRKEEKEGLEMSHSKRQKSIQIVCTEGSPVICRYLYLHKSKKMSLIWERYLLVSSVNSEGKLRCEKRAFKYKAVEPWEHLNSGTNKEYFLLLIGASPDNVLGLQKEQPYWLKCNFVVVSASKKCHCCNNKVKDTNTALLRSTVGTQGKQRGIQALKQSGKGSEGKKTTGIKKWA